MVYTKLEDRERAQSYNNAVQRVHEEQNNASAPLSDIGTGGNAASTAARYTEEANRFHKPD